MKKIVALILIISVLFSFSAFGAKVDNTEIKSTLLNGTTMVPLEDLAKLLELEFWPSSENYSVSEKNDYPRMLVFNPEEPGKAYAQSYVKEKDGNLRLTDELELSLPENITRIDGKLYVPYRFVLEFYKANVYWTEEDGAYAYRTSYGEPALIRTNGDIRERVSLSESYENAVIVGDYVILIRGAKLYRLSLVDGSEKEIGESGRVHVEGDKLFVLGSGKLTLIDVITGESKLIEENIRMVGYLAGGGAWCDKIDGSAVVYDASGNLLANITGEFTNPWEYQEGFVYYLTPGMELRRAKPDGTEDEVLARTALYPEWIDGYIYYIDSAMNYRRINAETFEDIMVYGLNLEQVGTYNGKYIFNFYSESFNRLFISNPDGTEFKPFGEPGVVVSGTPVIFRDGIVAKGIEDDHIYYITENKTEKLTDDTVEEFCGIHEGFVYYTVK